MKVNLTAFALLAAFVFGSPQMGQTKEPIPLEDLIAINSELYAMVLHEGMTQGTATQLYAYCVVLMFKAGQIDGSPHRYDPRNFRERFTDLKSVADFIIHIFKIHGWTNPLEYDPERGVVDTTTDTGSMPLPVVPGERRGC
jgi:hypothetical protein